ncbi:MAG: efflux RND transporter periplasmic adaptor subunit [Candidatus Pacebacteria bacterium]|nr:efflux RND transporter periplasmic adaptor subunit [Candidatus Paceibacterota bacterium]
MEKIKNTKNKILILLKKPRFYIPAIIIVIILVSLSLINNNKNKTEELIKIKRSDVVQIISVSGKTKPASSADLAFEKSGKVTYVFVNIGDRVTAGQSLVRLDSSELNANLLQMQANLSAEQSKLREMMKGTRVEEIDLQNTKTNKAGSDFSQSKVSLVNNIRDTYTVADDSIRNKLYPIFVDPVRYNAYLKFSADSDLEEDIRSEKNDVEDMLNMWNRSLRSLTESSDLVSYYNTARTNLNAVKKILDDSALAVNTISEDIGITQAEIDSWKLNISTARANINLAINNLTSSIKDYDSLSYSYKISQNELTVKESGYTIEQINAQQSLVDSVNAQVAGIQSQLSKNVIYSPIDGIISRQEAKVGEIVFPNTIMVSVMSTSNFEVEAYVPEINIGKVSIGNVVKMTMDAFSEEEFIGKLVYIEPAETLIDNIPNFKLKIVFDKEDSRLKSGLTVDADIEVNKKENVVSVPRYAINEIDGKYFVQKKDGNNVITKNIDIGIQGDNGMTEVIYGLEEGDEVLFSGSL